MQYKHITRKQSINMISTIEIDILVTIRTNENNESIRSGTHGMEIFNRINKHRQQFDIPMLSFGSLYPTLHRMEQKNLIEIDTKQTHNHDNRIYYRLTEIGNDYLNRVLCYRKKLLEN